MAGGQGFEPRYYGPEPHVLPLDDPPVRLTAACQRLRAGKLNPAAAPVNTARRSLSASTYFFLRVLDPVLDRAIVLRDLPAELFILARSPALFVAARFFAVVAFFGGGLAFPAADGLAALALGLALGFGFAFGGSTAGAGAASVPVAPSASDPAASARASSLRFFFSR